MKNKALTLLKVQLINSFGLSKYRKVNEKIKTILFLSLIAIGILFVMFSLGAGYYGMATVLKNSGDLHVLLLVCASSVSMAYVIFTLFKAPGFLYGFKDFDFLMSLPVKESDVLFSKISIIYISNSLIGAVLYIPPVVVFGIVSGEGVVYYLLAVVLFFFMPFIPMIVAIAFSIPLAFVAARIKFTNLLMIVGSMAFILFWMIFPGRMINVSQEQLASSLQGLSRFGDVYFPAKLFAFGLGDLNFLPILLFMAINIVVFIALLVFYGKSFRKINVLMNEHSSKSNYKMQRLKVSSKLFALYKKEIGLYFSYYIYVMNTAIGAVLITFYTVSLAVFNFEMVADMLSLPESREFMLPVTVLCMVFFVGMNPTTSTSLSIEGNRLPLLKSLPLRFIEIALAKILVCLTVNLPAAFVNSIILAYALKFSFFEWLGLVLCIAAFCVLFAATGLIMNLHFPKLEWKNPVQVVKQSMSVIVTMFLNMGIIAVAAIFYFLFRPDSFALFLALTGLVTYAVSVVLITVYIKNRGEKIFAKF